MTQQWIIAKNGIKFDRKFVLDQHLMYVRNLRADYAFYGPHSQLLHFSLNRNMFRGDGNMYHRLPTDRPGPITWLSQERRQQLKVEAELQSLVALKWGPDATILRNRKAGIVMVKFDGRVIEMSDQVYDALVLQTSAKEISDRLNQERKP